MSCGYTPRRRHLVIGKSYLERGKPCIVLIRWNGRGPRNVLIQRHDGSRVVRPFRGLRLPRT
jgi:acetyl esterase